MIELSEQDYDLIQQRMADGDVARDRVTELESKIAALETLLATIKAPEAYTELALGWMQSSIGKRANDNPRVDLAGFQLGVQRNSFPLIKVAYANILETLKADGQPATTKEQQEIGLLLKRLGFA